jgi:hypothetical protein
LEAEIPKQGGDAFSLTSASRLRLTLAYFQRKLPPPMYPAILANVARHITLTAEECALFTALLVPQHVVRTGLVVEARQRPPQLTFVVRGCVRTYTTDAHGRERLQP